MHLQAHHQLFAERIDRRIGDLGKTLLEVVVEEVGLGGEHRQGDVIAHAVGGLLALTGHVLDHQIEILGREPEGGLVLEQIEFAHRLGVLPGLGLKAAALLLEPGAIGMAGRHLFLDLPVLQQATVFQVDGQHLARAEPTLFNDPAFLDGHHTGFRTHHHQAIASDAVAGRPQSVAIQRSTHTASVTEHQQRRAIPGFLEAGGVLVKCPHLWAGIEFRLLAKGLRHQGQEAVGDWPAAAHHQLEHGVEIGRIAEGRVHNGLEVGGGGTPGGIEVGFGGLGPVEIAQQGIDFTVVAQQPHRLGQGPAGQGVGAEAAVIHRETHGKALVSQVVVEGRQHFRAHHPLVNQGAAAERSEVKVSNFRPPGFPDQVTDPPAAAKQQRLQGITAGVGLHQPLLDHRGGLAGQGAENTGINRHRAPTQTAQAKALGGLFTKLAGLLQPLRIGRQEQHGQTPPVGHRCARFRPDRFEKTPGDAGENAGAIAGVAVTATATAVLHAAERLQGLQQQAMGGSTIQLGQKTNPAGVLFPGDSRRCRAVAMGPEGTGGMRHGPEQPAETSGSPD